LSESTHGFQRYRLDMGKDPFTALSEPVDFELFLAPDRQTPTGRRGQHLVD